MQGDFTSPLEGRAPFSGDPTIEERRKKMSDDELRSKDSSWVAYYLRVGLRESRDWSTTPGDPIGMAKERLKEIFPRLSEDEIHKLISGAGERYAMFENRETHDMS